MRVLSKDKCTNVNFDNNTFCIIKDDENNTYTIAVRTPNLLNFFPLAEYDTEKEAMDKFMELSNAYSSFDIDTFEL